MTIPISIVIPTHNRAAELDRALQSLTAQTCQAFEVIVCDDGSDDDIQSVVARYAEQLSIKYTRIDKSGGPGRPRNVAVSLATGRWIAFLDSDDWWKPDRIETVMPALREDVDVVYHRLRVVDFAQGQHSRLHPRVLGDPCGTDPLRYMVTRGNPIPNSAALVKRASIERIGGITENFHSVEDFDTWLRLAEVGAIFLFIDQELGYYSVSSDNMSTFSGKQLSRQKILFDRHLPALPAAIRPIAESYFSYLIGSYALRLGKLAMAQQYLARVRPGIGPARWVRSMVKRVYVRLNLMRDAGA